MRWNRFEFVVTSDFDRLFHVFNFMQGTFLQMKLKNLIFQFLGNLREKKNKKMWKSRSKVDVAWTQISFQNLSRITGSIGTLGIKTVWVPMICVWHTEKKNRRFRFLSVYRTTANCPSRPIGSNAITYNEGYPWLTLRCERVKFHQP